MYSTLDSDDFKQLVAHLALWYVLDERNPSTAPQWPIDNPELNLWPSEFAPLNKLAVAMYVINRFSALRPYLNRAQDSRFKVVSRRVLVAPLSRIGIRILPLPPTR